MSPIGRVFIVLNLILAGTFVGFSGTYLQKQFNWKSAHEKLQTESKATIGQISSENERLRGEVSQMTTSKSTIEQELSQTKNERDMARDEVKRLEASHTQKDADLKKLASEIGGIKTQSDTAFNQSKEAYQASIAATKDKDDAVRVKDATLAENRDLKNQITALNETVQNKDLAIADLSQEKGRLTLLVDVAKQKGFMESLAVPDLKGTVANVSGKLCTIRVASDASAEVKPGFRFAIFSGSVYKGEARVTDVAEEGKAALCTLDVRTGTVMVGDSAATHLD